MKVLSVLVTVASTLAHGAVEAQDQSESGEGRLVEEVFVAGELSGYGATKSSIPIIETTRSISIETEKMFRDKGALTLDDTLNYTSGVVGDTFGFSTRGDFPKVRGFDAAEYRDGQQVLFGFYNNTRSDVYMLEQVEILKGPSSVLYGKGTPGGVVNAISKLAGAGKKNEFVLDVGSFDRYQAAVDYNHSVTDELYVRVVGLYRDAGTQVDNVDDNAQIIMPSITYETESSSITGMVEIVDRESDTAHQFLPLTGTACVSGDVTVNPEIICANATGELIEASTYLGEPGFNRYDTESVLVSLLGSHQFTDTLSLEGIARYKDGEADYRQTWISFLGTGVPRIDATGFGGRSWYISEASSEQTSIDLRLRWEFNTGPLEHELFAGFAYQDVTTDNDSDFAYLVGFQNAYNPVYGNIPDAIAGVSTPSNGPESQTDDLGFYINNQISMGNLKVNLGVRLDDTETESNSDSQKDDETSVSVGVLYAFDSGVSPYISYAESFEPVLGVDEITGELFKPREGEQMELGVKLQPRGSATYITFAYFEIEESNLTDSASLIGVGASQQEGVGEVSGFEIEALTTLGDWYLEGNISVLDTEDADGFAFESIPDEQASAWVQYQPGMGALADFRFGFGLRYAGESESNDFSFVINPPNPEVVTVTTDGYLLADMLIGYTMNDWDLSLNVRNTGDEEYYGTCLARGDCFPGEERSIVARIAKQF